MTFEKAVLMWLFRWEGMYHQESAALLGENQGRPSEVVNRKSWPGSEEAAREVLAGIRPRPPMPKVVRRSRA